MRRFPAIDRPRVSYAESLEPRRLLAAIASGQTLAGTISAPTQRDTYTFSAQAGGSIAASVGAVGSSMSSRIQVFTADGLLLASARARAGTDRIATLAVPAPFAGTYSLVVSSANGVTGNYNVAEASVPGPQVTDDDGGPIASGQVVNGSIAGDLDAYTFTADQGARIDLSMQSVQSPMRGRLELFDPDGRRIGAARARPGVGTAARLSAIAPLSGTYYVLAASGNGTGGAYTLSGTFVPPFVGGSQVVSIAATDPAAAEAGPDAGTFTVTRTGSTATALLVRYTVGGTATSGADYDALSGTVLIPAGQSQVTITVTPKDDTQAEPTETVIVTLARSAGYTLDADPAKRTATVQIVDDDTPSEAPVLGLVATDPTASESAIGPTSSGAFTLTRSAATGVLTVQLDIAGDATPNADYRLFVFGAAAAVDPATHTLSLTLPTGRTAVRIIVEAVNDNVAEAAEQVTLALRPGTGFTADPTANAAAVTIADRQQ